MLNRKQLDSVFKNYHIKELKRVTLYKGTTNKHTIRYVKISSVNYGTQVTAQCIKCGQETTYRAHSVNDVKLRPHAMDFCESKLKQRSNG